MKSDRAATRPLRLAVAAASLVLLALTGCPAQQGADTAAVAPESEEDKAFYTLGFFVMSRASEFELDEREKGLVLSGARDALEGEDAVVDTEVYQQRLAAIFRERQSRGADGEKLDSQKWVNTFAEKSGAVKTPSGLVFIETSAGEGSRPAATDTVRVHYHGTMRDGTIFDSSVDRGTPAVFPLNRVIPCWTEALQRMSVGGKAEVVCPSSIAYGDRGAPPKIQPGSALHFDVELIEIVEGPPKG
ncbi:MAG: FKBP-type peptidyl-prolyl cis-trans isomerase [Deltaproteobacteria bacterium]|nr:FKBP-type peptidyl-prolyl cis-trans isomerase [Deltaproteobacteria bacterium]